MGLYDRSYMYQQQEPASKHSRAAVWWLIAINAAVFFFFKGTDLYQMSMLRTDVLGPITAIQLLTCGFLHGDLTHLLFNMYGLYLFGSIAAPCLGEKKFYTLYLAGIILSSLTFYIINMGKPMYLLGASGAICSVTIAAAMVSPDKKFVIIFMPFTPIKITTMVICYTLINFLMTVNNIAGDSISYLAHLAGFISGYLLMKLIAKDDILWDPLKRKTSAAPPPPRPKQEKMRNTADTADDSAPVSNAELDALLDKISSSGINSLSDYELSRLRKARKQMRGE